MTRVIRLDDAATWPRGFINLVDAVLNARDDEAPVVPTEEDARRELSGNRVRAYHCTRLTGRELESVRSVGLQPLSPEFTARRIREAVLDGHLTGDEGRLYEGTTLPKDANRRGRVWFFTDSASLLKAPQIGYLVEVWGGEGINMALSNRSPEMIRLERVGVPSVVVAALDLDRHCDYAHPGILAAALRARRCSEGGTSIMCRSVVEPEFIEAIEHPGSDFWERHVWTPRSGFVCEM